jgi:hypothetical protein
MTQKIIIILSVLFISFNNFSQSGINKRNSARKDKNPFSTAGDRGQAIYSHSRSHFRPFGFHFSPGITYMAGYTNADDDKSYNLKPAGTPGYYLEIGLEHVFKKRKKVFHYIDYSFGIKHFGGQEKLVLEDGTEAKSDFNFGAVFGRFDIHNVWQLSKWNFIDQSIGLNVDYTVYGGNRNEYKGNQYNDAEDYQQKFLTQLHYSIGWGIKPRDGFFIVPTLQTPILTAWNWRNFNPSHRWFSSKYQPIIFSVKVAWLFVKRDCPAVYDAGGKRSSESYQNM